MTMNMFLKNETIKNKNNEKDSTILYYVILAGKL